MADEVFRSRAALVRKAVRPSMPARVLLSGPAGSGKTWSALTVARVLVGHAGRIVVIDTEEESALTYADEHVFEHLPWAPPYEPRELAATVSELASDPSTCVIIDSGTHFWNGEGGTLDIADGRFGGWKVATPAQDDMVRAMLRSRGHIIMCVREKQAYAVTETVENGRTKQSVQKLGMQPIQRDGLDYEFNVAVSMDVGHEATVTKTRCRQLTDRRYKPNHIDDLADTYKAWLAGGHPTIDQQQTAYIRAQIARLPGSAHESFLRSNCVAEFRDRFGPIDHILVDDWGVALELLHRYIDEAEGAFPQLMAESPTPPLPGMPAEEPPQPQEAAQEPSTPPETDDDGGEPAEEPTAPEPVKPASRARKGRGPAPEPEGAVTAEELIGELPDEAAAEFAASTQV